MLVAAEYSESSNMDIATESSNMKMIVAAEYSDTEQMLLNLYKKKKSSASYEGGPTVPWPYDDGLTPMCTSVKCSMLDSHLEYPSTIFNRAYIDALAAQGASELREEVQPELDSAKTVAINFVVPYGLIAIPAYTEEFKKEIEDKRVTWALCFVDVDSLDDADTQMIYGDTTVLVQDMRPALCDAAYVALRFLDSKIDSNARVIFNFLMHTKDCVRFGLFTKTCLGMMREKLNPDNLSLQTRIFKLDYWVVQSELKEDVVLPYSCDMPGVWRDVHDGLDPEHQDKKLIVTPVIVYCDAGGRAQKADFEFALCQSNRSYSYPSDPRTKDLSAVISATIIVHKEGDNIRFVSKFLYVTKKNRDLLKKHEGQVVMVLSNAALADVKLKSALTDKLEIPVNSISLNMSKEHVQIGLIYKTLGAVPVRDSITQPDS